MLASFFPRSQTSAAIRALLGLQPKTARRIWQELGITTVEGNQPVAETTENALRVVEFLARRIPVAAGANRPLASNLNWVAGQAHD